jgi:hypothetical protein
MERRARDLSVGQYFMLFFIALAVFAAIVDAAF